ncbi:MAG: metallophosphoesterase [Solobacterium sp.]|nr:metallophosphoesterase [Erysipelotrichaceae bacterium]MBQ9154684.1 metallophosphoesterase [Solobacterium sp.]
MPVYAIGDLHLSFSSDKSMDRWGGNWLDHENKILKYFPGIIRDDDILFLLGDHSWGRKLEECEADLEFIARLPGRKILTRGNHDLFWEVRNTKKLNQRFAGRLEFLQGGYFPYGEYAFIATKGYSDEGFDEPVHAEKMKDRELLRLQQGILAAKKDGYEKLIVLLHYPPTDPGKQSGPFTGMAEQYHVQKVVYAHLHGPEHFNDSLTGNIRGIEYQLVSGDYLDWRPERIL